MEVKYAAALLIATKKSANKEESNEIDHVHTITGPYHESARPISS